MRLSGDLFYVQKEPLRVSRSVYVVCFQWMRYLNSYIAAVSTHPHRLIAHVLIDELYLVGRLSVLIRNVNIGST